MFATTAQQNQIRNVARKIGVRFTTNDPFEVVVFLAIEKLLTKVEKLEKEIKDLNSDN